MEVTKKFKVSNHTYNKSYGLFIVDDAYNDADFSPCQTTRDLFHDIFEHNGEHRLFTNRKGGIVEEMSAIVRYIYINSIIMHKTLQKAKFEKRLDVSDDPQDMIYEFKDYVIEGLKTGKVPDDFNFAGFPYISEEKMHFINDLPISMVMDYCDLFTSFLSEHEKEIRKSRDKNLRTVTKSNIIKMMRWSLYKVANDFISPYNIPDVREELDKFIEMCSLLFSDLERVYFYGEYVTFKVRYGKNFKVKISLRTWEGVTINGLEKIKRHMDNY